MADLSKIKRNVSKMVSMKAPEQDIDSYISSEGVTVDDVKNFTDNKSIIDSNFIQNGKDVRGAKVIPQITKGLYDAYHSIPGVKQLLDLLPNAQKIQQNMATTPPAMTTTTQLARTAAETIPTAINENVIIPTEHFWNQQLLNIPRETSRAAGISYPEPQTPSGKILSYGAGVVGGFTNPLLKLLGLDKIGKVEKGVGLMKKLLTASGKGAAMGAAYTPEGGVEHPIATIPQRLEQGMFGAVAAPVAESAIGITKSGVKGLRKFKSSIKSGKPLDVKIANLNRQAEQQIEPKIEKATQQLKDNLANSEKEVSVTSQLETREAKPKLRSFYKENSDIYGKELEKMPNIPQNDVQGIILNTEKEAIENGLDTSVLNGIKEKYNVEQPNKFLKTTSFKDFKHTLDLTRQRMSAGARGAKGEYKPDDDLVIAMLFDKFGDYHSVKVPEFGKLQASYKPVIERMKYLNKNIKPGSPELSSGARFLELLSGEKAHKDILGQESLSLLEQGQPGWAKGVGKVAPYTRGALERAKTQKVLDEKLKKDLTEQLSKRKETYTKQSERYKTLKHRKNIGNFVKTAVTGGGVIPVADYLIRRKIAKAIMK